MNKKSISKNNKKMTKSKTLSTTSMLLILPTLTCSTCCVTDSQHIYDRNNTDSHLDSDVSADNGNIILGLVEAINHNGGDSETDYEDYTHSNLIRNLNYSGWGDKYDFSTNGTNDITFSTDEGTNSNERVYYTKFSVSTYLNPGEIKSVRVNIAYSSKESWGPSFVQGPGIQLSYCLYNFKNFASVEPNIFLAGLIKDAKKYAEQDMSDMWDTDPHRIEFVEYKKRSHTSVDGSVYQKVNWQIKYTFNNTSDEPKYMYMYFGIVFGMRDYYGPSISDNDAELKYHITANFA